MAPILLKTYQIPIDIHQFLQLCWYNHEFYEHFMIQKLQDIHVTIGEWTPHTTTTEKLPHPHLQQPIQSQLHQSHLKIREIKCFHPSKISFPGLPSHAESIKVQTMEILQSANVSIISSTTTTSTTTTAPPPSVGTGSGPSSSLHNQHQEITNIIAVNIREVNSFRGIPYADYFNVISEWKITELKNEKNGSTGGGGCCQVEIFLDFTFHKSTWLQGTIESNTKAELIEVFELWYEAVTHQIRTVETKKYLLNAQNLSSLSVDAQDMKKSENHNNLVHDVENNLQEQDDYPYDEDDEMLPKSKADSNNTSDADDLQFYDAEDYQSDTEGVSPSKLSKRYHTNDSTGKSVSQIDSFHGFYEEDHKSEDLRYSEERSLTPREQPSLQQIYQQIQAREKEKLYSSINGQEITTTRDLAVSIVETVFVLAEFSFWQVYRFYAYDLKDLFRVDISRLSSRIINSFIPGWHTPLLLTPDLYGPLIAVFTLPQTLLLSMETSRHGCNPTSQLGNAVIVSLLIWIGLSGLYRLLALLVAPSIGYKHCLSVIGYSFYSWNLAILCSLPLEHYKNQMKIPILLPLVIFGLPASISQGYMFWEHTPPSTIVLQPSTLPPSLQTFATSHSRIIQRFLWALPKIVAFILVAGTHYQLLWYMARVFLPGRRQLCRLSALIQPSQYAAILSQQEIRMFALKLLSGKDD